MVTINDFVRMILREAGVSAIPYEEGFVIAYYPDKACKLTDIALLLWRHAAHIEFFLDIFMGDQYDNGYSGVLIKWDNRLDYYAS